MTHADRAIGAVALALGLGWAALARGLPFQQGSSPGPGFLPLWLGLLLAALGAGLLAQSLAGRSEGPLGSGWSGTWRVLATFAALMGYVALISLLGFALSTALFLAAAIRFWGGYRWRWVLALAGGLALANYLIFQLWLGLSLPAGLLDLG